MACRPATFLIVSNRFGRWTDSMFNRADATLARLQCRCPKCGGNLDRKFSLLDKVALYIPLPHTIYAYHECERCHTRFRSFLPLTDFYLEGSWSAATFFMGELWPIALACPLTWLVCSWWFKREQLSGTDTTIAGAITAILWVLALVFGNLDRGGRMLQHPVMMMALTAAVLFTSVGLVLVLNRHTTFKLQEIGSNPSRAA